MQSYVYSYDLNLCMIDIIRAPTRDDDVNDKEDSDIVHNRRWNANPRILHCWLQKYTLCDGGGGGIYVRQCRPNKDMLVTYKA